MTTIQAPKSVYEQIADLLRERIEDGTYPAGSTLPSEPELSAQLNVSRVTINRAVAQLRAEGMVKVRRGAGTQVRSLPMITRDAKRRYAARSRGTGAGQVEVTELGLRSRTEYRHIGQVTATSDVAQALRLDDGAAVLVRRRVLYANDEPTQIADSYYPWQIAEGTALLDEDTGTGGSYGRLADLGYGPVRFTEKVGVRMPTSTERASLELEANQPVFTIEHIAWASTGTPVEVVHHTMPGHLWSLLYEWDDDTDPTQAR